MVQPLFASDESTGPSWYRDAWRRAVIDMHIPDWDEKFLSQFDPRQYARNLVRCRAQSIVCYCQSHVGLFNYPTKVGRQHRAFHGRNVMREMIDACHEHDIAVVLYCSLIFDRYAADTYPQWCQRTWDGKIQGEGGRHGIMCCNSPYREYVRRFTTEICENFDFEGIRFDMTFWPWLCYCQYCSQRYDKEVGGEIPKTINWLDEKWVGFQRMRERSMVDFARVATSTVKKLKPTASVEHQSSTYPLNWMFGVTEPLAEQNDFLQGDFYGDQLQGSFVRKLLERLTPNRPFGYETSFSRELKDHTAMKSEPLLEAKASAAIADGAAFIFIDAIDPIGTVNHRAHDRMGRIFDRLMPYYDHLGGARVEDVGIYYSLESKFDMQSNGKHVSAPDTNDTHTQSCMNVAARLIRAHLPFGVLTKSTLEDLSRFEVLILSNVHMMDEQECETIRRWVAAGGKLLATGGSSLVTKEGKLRKDFMLSDVFGVSLVKADWTPRKHYLAPAEGAAAAGDREQSQGVLPEFDAKYPAYTEGPGFTVKSHSGTRVLGTSTLPWPREDGSKFSSIHSDPPWVRTGVPEITHHKYGHGEVVYCASLVEAMENAESTVERIVRSLHSDFHFEVAAPGCVEVTLFRQADRGRYLLCLLNFQKELPNIPIHDIACRLRVDERIAGVRQINSDASVSWKQEEGQLQITVPKLETLAMLAIDWREG